MGDLADRVMYRDLDHLHSLIDGYRSNPRRRREVAAELRQRVLRDFTFAAFCRRALVEESAWQAVQ